MITVIFHKFMQHRGPAARFGAEFSLMSVRNPSHTRASRGDTAGGIHVATTVAPVAGQIGLLRGPAKSACSLSPAYSMAGRAVHVRPSRRRHSARQVARRPSGAVSARHRQRDPGRVVLRASAGARGQPRCARLAVVLSSGGHLRVRRIPSHLQAADACAAAEASR